MPQETAKPGPKGGHAALHFFKGACICPCSRCTRHEGKSVVCVDDACPPELCGAKTPFHAR